MRPVHLRSTHQHPVTEDAPGDDERMMIIVIDAETERQIRLTLHEYCDAFDQSRFDDFADLFAHGRWFMVDRPGSPSVRRWIDDHVILYDGRPLTRHEISNLIVEPGDRDGLAEFRCYVAIWQHLPEADPRLLVHARFVGTFRRIEEGWRWSEHEMVPDWTRRLETHLTGVAPGQSSAADETP